MTFAEWRERARGLLAAHLPPEEVFWGDEQPALFEVAAAGGQVRIPKRFVDMAEIVACHSDSRRWSLMYRVAYRLLHGEPRLLEIDTDADARAFLLMERSVQHDIHRMHGFVRFRSLRVDGEEEFVAWHRPDHHVVERAAPFFANRFANMRWSILTPQGCAYWDRERLRFGPGVPRTAAPDGDDLEQLWRAYYGAVFNPARTNERLLLQHMPRRHWAALPECAEVPGLLAGAGDKLIEIQAAQRRSAADYIPAGAGLAQMEQAIRHCRGCDLYAKATHPVFGEGPADAHIMLVAEQPGDNEDREGRAFIGPAGQLLDRALAEAGLDRKQLYITGAVKHFKFEERGKRRIHKTADRAEVAACQPWLDRQIELIRPKLIVVMGATAGLSVLGRRCEILRERGRLLPHPVAGAVFVTIHPSFILRIPEAQRQTAEYALFVRDLRTIAAQAA